MYLYGMRRGDGELQASENGGSPIQMGALRRGKQVLEDSDDEDAMKCE